MDNLQASRMVDGNPQNGRAAMDFYPTLPEATGALLDFLLLPPGTRILEPACGDMAMVKVMRERGYYVAATDIRRGTDFLKDDIPADDINWIITNPPFSLSEQFIERCAAYYKKPFALLLKSHYWHAARRLDLFRKYPPSHVLPLTWRPNFTGGKSPMMDVSWCVWVGQAEETIFKPLAKPKG